MIQVTDFRCPYCGAEVGKSCENLKEVWEFGKVKLKRDGVICKPHPQRLHRALIKRSSK